MANFKYKTRGNSNPQRKPKVFFTCHPEDFKVFFENISDEILSFQDCAIWYDDNEESERDEFYYNGLKQMQMFVMPVTTRLLTRPCRAMEEDFKFAIEHHIPVLPLMQESGLEEIFNKKFGDLQFLDKNQKDVTAISYEEKLKKYLESILLNDEIIKKIQDAFDAYIFLSYRKKDRIHAQELMKLIHKNEFCRDIAIWYDEFLTPGENFNDSIKEALEKSGLFVLVVTPNLVNEENYVMTTEYPMAREADKPILPAELVKTDKGALAEKYPQIPECADAHNETSLSQSLLAAIPRMAIKENDDSPQHNFFIGLAYLNGIDVEVDHKRALSLITSAAENGLVEAMDKLIDMYNTGFSVERNFNKAIEWHEKKIEVFKKIYSEDPTEDNLNKLFWVIIKCGDAYKDISKHDIAKKKYFEALDYSKKINTKDFNIARNTHVAYQYIGDSYRSEGEVDTAEVYYNNFLHCLEKYEKECDEPLLYRDFWVCNDRLGLICSERGDYKRALTYYRKSLESLNKCKDRCDSEAETIDGIKPNIHTYIRLGDAHLKDAKFDAAIKNYEQALKCLDRLNAVKNSREFYMSYCDLYKAIGGIYQMQSGNVEKGSEYIEKGIKYGEEYVEEYPHLYMNRLPLAKAYASVGSIYVQNCIEEKFKDAVKLLTKGIDVAKSILEHINSHEAVSVLAQAYLNLGMIYRYEDDYSNSRKCYEQIIEYIEKYAHHNIYEITASKIQAYSGLAYIYAAEKEKGKALECFQNALADAISCSEKSTIGKTLLAGVYFDMLSSGIYNASESFVYLHHSFNIWNGEYRRNPRIATYRKMRETLKGLILETSAFLEDDTASAEVKKDYFLCYGNLGVIYQEQGKIYEAEEFYEKAIKLYKAFANEDITSEAKRNLLTSYNNLGHIYVGQKEYHKSEECYEQAAKIFKDIAEETKTVAARKDLAASYTKLGDVYGAQRKGELAIEFHKKALDIRESIMEKTKTVAARKDLAVSYAKLGDAYGAQLKGELATKFHKKALDIRETIMEETKTAEAIRELFISYTKLGKAYEGRFRQAKAIYYHEKAWGIVQSLGKETGIVLPKRDLAMTFIHFGNYYKSQDKLIEAKECYEKVWETIQSLRKESGIVLLKRDLAKSFTQLGQKYESQGKLDQSKICYEKAVDIYISIAEETKTIQEKVNLFVTYSKIGEIYYHQGNLDEAKRYDEEAIKICRYIANAIQVKRKLVDSYVDKGYFNVFSGNSAQTEESIAKHCQLSEELFGDLDALYECYTLAQSYLTEAVVEGALDCVAEGDCGEKKRRYLLKAWRIMNELCKACPKEYSYQDTKKEIEKELGEIPQEENAELSSREGFFQKLKKLFKKER